MFFFQHSCAPVRLDADCVALKRRARGEKVALALGRFTGGREQFCPHLVGRFDKSGYFECRADLKRPDGRDGI